MKPIVFLKLICMIMGVAFLAGLMLLFYLIADKQKQSKIKDETKAQEVIAKQIESQYKTVTAINDIQNSTVTPNQEMTKNSQSVETIAENTITFYLKENENILDFFVCGSKICAKTDAMNLLIINPETKKLETKIIFE